MTLPACKIILPFELCLKLHQLAATVLVYSTISHILEAKSFDLRPVYVFAGAFGLLFGYNTLSILYRNKRIGWPWTQAQMERVGETSKISICLSRPIHVRAGQYLNIWIPRVQLFSSHPFMIVSSSQTKDSTSLQLIIESQAGFTRKLWQSLYREGHCERLLLFSGPHGLPASHCNYHTVFLIATGFGISSMFKYLDELIQESSISTTRRIRLVWIRGMSGKASCLRRCLSY